MNQLNCYFKTNRIGLLFVFGMLLVCVFCIGHFDANAIVLWGVELLRSVKNDRLYYYATDLTLLGVPTNYGIFINAVTAVAVFPLYILELLGKSVSLMEYVTWYKIILCVVLMAALSELSKFTERFSAKEDVTLIFGTSILAIFYSVAMGQVDMFAIFFVLLAMNCYEKEKWNWMAFFMALSFMVKAFPLIAMAPFFIYLFKRFFLGNKKKEFLGICFHFIWPIALERGIATFGMEDYYSYSNIVNTLNFIPRIFKINIGGVSVYLLLTVIVVMLFFGVTVFTKMIEEREMLLCINILYALFYALVDWSPQYLLYGFIFLLIGSIGALRGREQAAFGLMGIGALFVCIGGFNESTLNAMLMSNSLIGYMLHLEEVCIGTMLPLAIKKVFLIAGRGIIDVCYLYVILKQWRYCRERKINQGQEERHEPPLQRGTILLCGIPAFVYMVLLLYMQSVSL